ncbi:MAG: hypothetical protein FD122_3763 [Stygiobacter sp.]|nr:MAG: hypothetical protein FD122_3763 [Stygiobacter sp.]
MLDVLQHTPKRQKQAIQRLKVQRSPKSKRKDVFAAMVLEFPWIAHEQEDMDLFVHCETVRCNTCTKRNLLSGANTSNLRKHMKSSKHVIGPTKLEQRFNEVTSMAPLISAASAREEIQTIRRLHTACFMTIAPKSQMAEVYEETMIAAAEKVRVSFMTVLINNFF